MILMFITFLMGVSLHFWCSVSLARLCFLAISSFILLWIDCFTAFRFTFSDFYECFNFFSFKDSWYLQWDILTEGSMSFAKKWQTGCRLTKTLQQSETRENKLLNKIVFPGIKKLWVWPNFSLRFSWFLRQRWNSPIFS